MEKNDYKVLIKEYEKLNSSRPDIYPLTFDEVVEALKVSLTRESLMDTPAEKEIRLALLRLDADHQLMKYYLAFKSHDMEALNDALYETAHLMQIANILNTGVDQGYLGMNITPNLLAANMMDQVKLCLPEENGFGKGNYGGTHIANLLMAAMYDNEDFKREALTLSERELNKKIPVYLKSYIECMRAIVQQNHDEVNSKLEAFCADYMKRKDFRMNGFNRRFCVEAHGMYNLAIWAYEGKMREKIKIPGSRNFCQELAMYQESQGFKPGKVAYHYPEELDLCNEIMNCQPPKMHLIRKGKKMSLDFDRYFQEIVESLSQNRLKSESHPEVS